MGDWRVHFPVIGADYDDEGRPKTRPCTDLLVIKNGFDKLSLVPLKANGVHITGFSETDNEFPAANEYRVNYVTGRVYFNKANEGQTCTAIYDGIGTLVGVDEINWLWEKTAAYADFEYYTALKDTPYVLVPRAVQIANKDANAIEQMSPEIGRSYSDAILLYDKSGYIRFNGTIFDAVSLWKINLGLQEPDVTSFKNGLIENLLLSGTNFVGDTDGGYLWSVTSLNSIGKRSVGHVELKAHTGDVRLLFSIERVYHKWNGNTWEVVGDYGTAKTTGTDEWNTPEEIASIPISGFQYLLNKEISVAAYAADGASFTPEFLVSIENAESFTRYDTSATFSIKEEEWRVSLPSKANWVIIRGSGRDDVVCGSEVIDFKNVNPNETVKVTAPVRTNINVLLGGTRYEDKVYFPTANRSWYPFYNDKMHPINQHTLPYAAFDGNLFTEYERDDVFSSLTQAQKNLTVAYDLKLGKYENYISSLDYPELYKKKGAFVPGNCGLCVPIGPTGYYIRMLPLAQVDLKNASAPKSMGFLFRVWQEPVTIVSTGINNWNANTRLTLIVRNSKLYIRRDARENTPNNPLDEIREDLICNINKNQWNSIVLYNQHQENPSCTHGQATTSGPETVHVAVNGTDYEVHVINRAHACGIAVPNYFPDTIGPDPLGPTDIVFNNTGVAFVAMPFAMQVNLSLAQATEISSKLLALGAQNREPPATTARIVTEQLFMDNMDVANYATLALPEGWQYMPHEPLFAFWDTKQLLTIRRGGSEVIEIPSNSEYDDIRTTCADILTLRNNASLLASGYFANYQLVCFSKDEGRYKQLYGAPGQLIASGTQVFNEYSLATQSTARIQYIDGEWRVTNLTSKVTDIRVAILGGSILTSAMNGNLGGGLGLGGGESGSGCSWSLIEKFVDLPDTPGTLLDNDPKALVSYKGMVQKMPYIHPFLLRHL